MRLTTLPESAFVFFSSGLVFALSSFLPPALSFCPAALSLLFPSGTCSSFFSSSLVMTPEASLRFRALS